ncbi:DUF1702 family protein [Saccharothrix obliqua]|uniref:DUF1702 family protein n=1 Tax=Saccharothrix obliqua TaxID=2861747 RepID=UPI001C5EFE40|nr:DUF1702 family protein [Saccharothrix obliqua]
MADFGARGFRTDRPVARAVLEEHARMFLTGFNIGAAHWRAPHAELAGRVPDAERGFAYEGAGMFAGLLDLATAGRARAVRRLLAGPGHAYTHLVHVGAGWLLSPLRVTAVPRVPATPLLRWLAVDGAGFGEVYFGGTPALVRRAHRRPDPRWEARLAGCGRALWFAESADVAGVAAVVDRAAPAARPHLWAGVGLAVAYAGAADDAAFDALEQAVGPHFAHFGQGVVFAAAARHRSGVVPAHTERAVARFLGVGVAETADWSEAAARGLTDAPDLLAFLRWKARLRATVDARR